MPFPSDQRLVNASFLDALKRDDHIFFGKLLKGGSEAEKKAIFCYAINFNATQVLNSCLLYGIGSHSFSVQERCALSEKIEDVNSTLAPEIRSILLNEGFVSKSLSLSELSEDQIQAFEFDKCEFFEKSNISLIDLTHFAIHFGAQKIFQFCIKNQIDAKYLDPKYRATLYSALHNALNTGKSEIILQMISYYNLKFFKISDTFLTDLFHLSIHFGEMHIFQFCLNNGVDCTQLDYEKNTALYRAINTTKPDFALKIIEKLISLGCDPEKKLRRIDNQSTLLHQAVRNGLNDVVKFFLKKKYFFIDASDNNGMTPLFYAVQKRNVEAVRLLLTAGANAEARSSSGVDLIWHAAYNRILNKEIFELLLKYGANPNTLNPEGKNIAVFLGEERSFLASNNVEDVIKLFTSSNALNLKENNSTARLHSAIDKGEIKSFYDCLEKGADWKKADLSGDSVLVQALYTDKPEFALEMLQELIKRGCEPTDLQHKVKDEKGNGTLLHAAAVLGLNEVVAFLLENKWFSPNEQDDIGRTPLYFAMKGKHMGIVKLLLELGARNCHANFELSIESQNIEDFVELSANIKKSSIVAMDRLRPKSFSTTMVSLTIDYAKSFFSDYKEAFYIAISTNNIEDLRYCLKNGVSVDSFSLAERHVLSEAIQNVDLNFTDEIRLELFNNGFVSRRVSLSKLSENEIRTLMKNAFVPGRLNLSKIDVVEIEMLKCDNLAFFEKSDIDLTDLFYLAIHFGAKEIFEFCLNNGVNCNRSVLKSWAVLYDDGKTLLHQAAYTGLDKAITFLLEGKHYSVDELDNNGMTPLFYALQAEKIETAKLLLNLGANINVHSYSGGDPILHAVYHETLKKEIIAYLFEHGAKPNLNSEGKSFRTIAFDIKEKRDSIERLKADNEEKRKLIEHLKKGESTIANDERSEANKNFKDISVAEPSVLNDHISKSSEDNLAVDEKNEKSVAEPSVLNDHISKNSEDNLAVDEKNEKSVAEPSVLNDHVSKSSEDNLAVDEKNEKSVAEPSVLNDHISKSSEDNLAVDEKNEKIAGTIKDLNEQNLVSFSVPNDDKNNFVDERGFYDAIAENQNIRENPAGISAESSSSSISVSEDRDNPVTNVPENQVPLKKLVELSNKPNASSVQRAEDIEEDENPPNPSAVIPVERSRMPSLFAVLTSTILTGAIFFSFGVSLAVAAITFITTTITTEVLHRHFMNQQFSASNDSEPRSSANREYRQKGSVPLDQKEEKSAEWIPFSCHRQNSAQAKPSEETIGTPHRQKRM